MRAFVLDDPGSYSRLDTHANGTKASRSYIDSNNKDTYNAQRFDTSQIEEQSINRTLSWVARTVR